MQNILLFCTSVLLYFGVWYGLDQSHDASQLLIRLGILLGVCIPFNIKGNVFTIAGNAVSQKSVYSLFSLLQEADRDAWTILGLAGSQKAGRDAVVLLGLAGSQKVGRNAWKGIITILVPPY